MNQYKYFVSGQSTTSDGVQLMNNGIVTTSKRIVDVEGVENVQQLMVNRLNESDVRIQTFVLTNFIEL